jgi:hypothetical protein
MTAEEDWLMAQGAVFIGWGVAARGREKASLMVFNEGVQYWTRLREQGEIESFEAAQLEPHGGDLAGFCLIRGDAEKLDRLRRSEEWLRLNARASMVVDNLGVVSAHVGEGLQKLFGQLGEVANELGG